MKERRYRILTILYQKYPRQWVSGVELAEILSISPRTLRADIATLNEARPGIIISNTHRGYQLDRELYYEFQQYQVDSETHDISQYPENRVGWILRTLLLNSEGVTMESLEEQFFVSLSTLEQDLAQIKQMIKDYRGLTLKKEQHRLFLEGMEYTKRKLYRDLLMSEVQGEFVNLNRLARLYPTFDLLRVADLFSESLEQNHYSVQQSLLPVLLMHVGISLERVISGQILHQEIGTKIDNESLEWNVASNFLQKAAQELGLTIPQCEIAILARLLERYRDLREPQETDTSALPLENFVIEALAEVQSIINIENYRDSEFVRSLCVHLQGLLERIEHDIQVPNALLKDIKQQYPLVFDIAVYLANRLSDTIGVPIREEEVGFIALHLGVSYAQFATMKKIQVVVVGNINHNLCKLVLEKLNGRFGDRMEIISVCPYFEATTILACNTDLIISLSPLQHHLPIETVVISPVLNVQEEMMLFKVLNELEKRRMTLTFNMRVEKLIDEEYFYSCLVADTPEAVIKEMVLRLQQGGVVGQSFLESCLQREAFSATSFDFSLAIPHPLVLDSTRSVISIAHLADPIRWGDTKVELVILLALTDEDQGFMTVFFDWLAYTISNPDRMKKLISLKSRDAFVQYLTQE